MNHLRTHGTNDRNLWIITMVLHYIPSWFNAQNLDILSLHFTTEEKHSLITEHNSFHEVVLLHTG